MYNMDIKCIRGTRLTNAQLLAERNIFIVLFYQQHLLLVLSFNTIRLRLTWNVYDVSKSYTRTWTFSIPRYT